MTALVHRAAVVVGVTAAALLVSSGAEAAQFVVFDTTYEHTPDLPDSHYRVSASAATPANWKSPVDYTTGTAHVHLEVLTKPTEQPTRFQVCFEGTPTYACTDQSPTYTKTGPQGWATKVADFYSPPDKTYDWTKGTGKVALILKDTTNKKPSADNVGATEAAKYMPTKLRVVVTIVQAGSVYAPPGPAPVGPGDAGTVPVVDAGKPDAAPPGDEEPAPPPGETSTSGGGAARERARPEPEATTTSGGCSAAATPRRATAAWPLAFAALAGLAFTRARRRRR